MASNFPLRGKKATVWEGGTRGMGFIHGAMLKKTGYRNWQLMHVPTPEGDVCQTGAN